MVLRGTLPPKPDSNKLNPHQQRITLGVKDNVDGLKYAEAKAKEIGGLVALSKFDWTPYIRKEEEPQFTAPVVQDWIEKLEKEYFSDKDNNDTTRQTWKHDYLEPFSKLTLDSELAESSLKATLLEKTKANTRTRRRYALAYAKLADIAGIQHGLRGMVGNYSSRSVSPRSLPSDTAIKDAYFSLTGNDYQWIFGVMAAYGIRNHEAFFLDFDDYPIAYINRGKTNERYAWPLYPEWVDEWNLKAIVLPDCTGRTNAEYGNRITKAFARLNVPFSPYNLRHSWARRSFEFGMDISLAARQMGHSVKVHTDTYRHWIDKSAFERAYRLLITHPDRPLAP